MPFVTLAAGVALADGIETSTSLRTILKWPNDVCVSRPDGSWRKLAGILAEARSAPDGTRYVVLGIGVNITPAAHPPEVLTRSTSIEAEVAGPVDRAALISECLAALSGAYETLRRGDAATILDAWTSRATATFGREVVSEAEGGAVRGVVEGIDASGALLIRTSSGHRRVSAGEVQWI
jgi:BirA family biotin operon repressor/biotin-[acetyl-CoA-carboxylase] ligase